MGEHKTEFKVYMGSPVDLGAQPPLVWIKEWPPLPGESSRDYRSRCKALVAAQLAASREEGRRLHTAAAWSMIAALGLLIILVLAKIAAS